MPAVHAYRSFRPDLRPCSFDVEQLPVLSLNGSTSTSQNQKVAFHRCARRYLRSVAGALAAAGYSHARVASNLAGVLTGGDTRLYAKRPHDLSRLIVVIEAGAALSTIPGIGRPDGMVVMAWRKSDVPNVARPHALTSRNGPNTFFADRLNSVELARRLLLEVMNEPIDNIATIIPTGCLRRNRPALTVAEQPMVQSEPLSLVDFMKMTMRLADDMAMEYPEWRYGCWQELPPAIKRRYACIAPGGA